jgi:uncharacterized protein YidB (DUF937 family)
MSRMPSMTALLGLLAVAGFQNRDKLAEMFKDATGAGAAGDRGAAGAPPSGQQKDPRDMLAGSGVGGLGGLLGGGLNDLFEQFRKNGHGDAAESWVGTGPNKELPPPQLKQAIGQDVLAALEQQTGLSQDELLARLSRELPDAVDKYTPDGRLPPRDAA